jgi:hypothetical protein
VKRSIRCCSQITHGFTAVWTCLLLDCAAFVRLILLFLPSQHPPYTRQFLLRFLSQKEIQFRESFFSHTNVFGKGLFKKNATLSLAPWSGCVGELRGLKTGELGVQKTKLHPNRSLSRVGNFTIHTSIFYEPTMIPRSQARTDASATSRTKNRRSLFDQLYYVYINKYISFCEQSRIVLVISGRSMMAWYTPIVHNN